MRKKSNKGLQKDKPEIRIGLEFSTNCVSEDSLRKEVKNILSYALQEKLKKLPMRWFYNEKS